MTAGIQISGQGGFTQIDSDMHNWRLVKKGVVNLIKFNHNTNSNDTPPIEVTGVSPIIFFGQASIRIAVVSKTRSGSTHSFRVAGDSSGSVPYYIFDRATPVEGSFGLQLFDGSGTIAFDSTDKMLRIQGLYSGAGGTISGLPTGKTYAAGVSFPVMGWVTFTANPFYMSYLLVTATKVSATSIEVGAEPVAIAPFEAQQQSANSNFYSSQQNANGKLIIADVTGY